MSPTVRTRLPDAAAGVATLLLAWWEAAHTFAIGPFPSVVLVVVGLAVAVGLSRLAPGYALGVAWLVAAVQVLWGTQLLLSEVLFAAVAFGCARWGRPVVVWLSGLSIPLAAAVAVLWLAPYVLYDAIDRSGFRDLAGSAYRLGGSYARLLELLIAGALLMAPWLLGLALRFSDRSTVSRQQREVAEAERDQAAEIARLRDEQTRLARDVHDVVGHSLAVILAQAESAQYLDDADTAALKRTMATIATSARGSLDDVRQVLASTSSTGAAAASPQPDLDGLVEGVRASGHPVESTVVGAPQPMPPELAVVAFRVLQEMLTNAIKHGRRDQPICVERHWDGDLRIEVRNAVADGPVDETQPIGAVGPGVGSGVASGGRGIDGMRRRLEAVGGRLDVRRRSDPSTFTATAWVPVRPR